MNHETTKLPDRRTDRHVRKVFTKAAKLIGTFTNVDTAKKQINHKLSKSVILQVILKGRLRREKLL